MIITIISMLWKIDGDTNCNWCPRNDPQRLAKGIGKQRASEVHPVLSIIKIGQNTEKSPGDLKRLAVTSAGVINSTNNDEK